MKTIIILILSTSIYANIDKSAWDRENDPYRIGIDYMTREYRYDNKFENLPLNGALDENPWSDDYWPTYKGGISYRWNQSGYDEEKKIAYKLLKKSEVKKSSLRELKSLSPAEKYDLLLGQYSYPLVNHERERTQVLRTMPSHTDFDFDYDIPTWEGLCHGWAPATLLYTNPRATTLKSPDGLEIPFGASDIKALLTFNMHYSKNVRSSFLGKRCNINFEEIREQLEYGEISQEEYIAKLQSAECLDVNAGSFHIVLANQIGKLKEGFIADVTRDFEVWNQPVFAYETNVIGQKDPTVKQREYGTKKVISIYLELHYVVERNQHWEYRDNYQDFSTKHYQYDLEINHKGDIIGGEWISEDRPDFLWKQDRPSFSGYFKKLEDLYNKSIED